MAVLGVKTGLLLINVVPLRRKLGCLTPMRSYAVA